MRMAAQGKGNDPRWKGFARQYGFDVREPVQWEVEALPPEELHRLVLDALAPYVDPRILAQQIAREEEQRRARAAFVRRWGAAEG
ncbi:hypothetical protein ACWCV9_33570 [Streptomyces sp. NPDC001606]